MDNTYFNELKAQIKRDIQNLEPNNSLERYGQEIKKVALGHNYDKEMITSLLDSIIEAGANLDIRSADWVNLKNNKISSYLGHNNFERFLKEYLTFENHKTDAPDSLRASQLDEKKLEAMFDILSVLNTKLVGVTKDVLAMFLVDMVFHNFFKIITKNYGGEDEQRQGFMGDAQSLLYDENTYLCLYQTLEFFEKNNIQITPDIKKQIESSLSEYLLECWCMDFDEEEGVPEDRARLGEATCLLYLTQILENDVIQITKFKKSLQKYAAKLENESLTIREDITTAMELLGTIIDKKILECEIGKKDKSEPGKKFKV